MQRSKIANYGLKVLIHISSNHQV